MGRTHNREGVGDFGEIKGDTRNGMMETQDSDCTLGKRRYPYRRFVSWKYHHTSGDQGRGQIGNVEYDYERSWRGL